MSELASALSTMPVVKVNGSLLPEDRMRTFVLGYVEDSRALPDAFELRFRDQDFALLDSQTFMVGHPVEVGFATSDESAPAWIMKGEVTAIELDADSRGTWAVVRGYDKGHRMQRGRRSEAYIQTSPSDVVRTILGRNGLQAGTIDATPVLDLIVQPNISDWDMISRLADDTGLEFSIREGTGSFQRPGSTGSPIALTFGEDLRQVRAAVTASEQVDDVVVFAWDPGQAKTIIGKKPATSSDTVEIGPSPKKMAEPFGAATMTITNAPHVSTQELADNLAAGVAARLTEVFAEVDAVVRGNPKLSSGAKVKLVNIGTKFEGTYTVTTARHLYDGENGYQTWLTISGRQDRTTLGLVGGGLGGAMGPDRIPGLAPAIVTDIQDPEKLGRVKIKLPWLDDSFDIGWARTLQLGGDQGGGMVLPEVGDEVLVGFEQHQVERPFVLGGLYNGKQKPPTGDVDDVDSNSGKVGRRRFASRSGNALELHDAQGAVGVRLTTGDDKHVLHLDQQGVKVIVNSDGEVEITGSKGVTVASGGDLALTADGNISMEAGGNIDIKATGNLSAQASGSATLEGAQTTVKGSTAGEVSSTGVLTVRGSLVKIN